MPETFNIYCDESCHLENDGISTMVLGCVWISCDKRREISRRIKEIKQKYNLSDSFEVKWTKISPVKVQFYLDLVDYFFDDDDLRFRGILIPDKQVLEHHVFDQAHDDWYYKMLFIMLEPIINPEQQYNIYLDIKDTCSEIKRCKLEDILRSSRHDYLNSIINRVQQIRSHESAILQMADLIIGAIGYHRRQQTNQEEELTNSGKFEVIRRIQRRSGKSLVNTTWLCESKFNLLVWRSGGHFNE